jgi:hypothetical protein
LAQLQLAQPLPSSSSSSPDARGLLTLLQRGRGSLALGLAEQPRTPAPHDVTEHARDTLAHLCDALLLPGAVVELVAERGSGAFSLAWRLMAEAARRAPPNRGWLGAVDPERTLCAPALAALGVPLQQLVVAAPPLASLARVAVRVARSQAFCALLVDATACSVLDPLSVAVRRLALAAEGPGATVFLMTSPRARAQAPLPCAVRAELTTHTDGVHVAFRRHRHGLRMPVTVAPAASALEDALDREWAA